MDINQKMKINAKNEAQLMMLIYNRLATRFKRGILKKRYIEQIFEGEPHEAPDMTIDKAIESIADDHINIWYNAITLKDDVEFQTHNKYQREKRSLSVQLYFDGDDYANNMNIRDLQGLTKNIKCGSLDIDGNSCSVMMYPEQLKIIKKYFQFDKVDISSY